MHTILNITKKNKWIIALIYGLFALFWIKDFYSAILNMIILPNLLFYIFKYNDNMNGFKNNNFISSVFLVIIISYFGYMAHYLSVPNSNNYLENASIEKDTYIIQEYQSVRTRVGSELIVKNKDGLKVMACTSVRNGRCPYHDYYGKQIYIESIKIDKNFRQLIFGKNSPNIVYYINYDGHILDNQFFKNKYHTEYQNRLLFILSINVYMLFIFGIKYIYRINILSSLTSTFSDKKSILQATVYIAIYLAYFFLFFI